MKVNLRLGDRLVLLNILPSMGDISSIRIVNDLRQKLSLSEEEYESFGITQDGGRIHWKRDESVEIEIGPRASEIIREALVHLNETKKLTIQHINLYSLFVEDLS